MNDFNKLNRANIKDILNKDEVTILEIGAHKGEDTLKFLNIFKDIRLFCFEPDPRCIKKWKERVNDGRAQLIEAALGNEDGVIALNISSGWSQQMIPKWVNKLGLSRFYIKLFKKEWSGSSSIKTSISHSKLLPWLSFDKKVDVNVYKLDTWIEDKNIGKIDFVWADVQGAEKDLINGAQNTLCRISYFFMEYGEVDTYPDSMSRKETLDLMVSKGFELVPEYSSVADRGNLLFKNTGA